MDYADAARAALRQKNLRLAIEQASAAVALRPLHEPHLRLLDEVIAASRGPLALVELPEDGAFYGLCAARARVLARAGRLEEALDLLFRVAAFRPRLPFLQWARDWMKAPKAVRKLRPVQLASFAVALADAMRGRDLDDGVAANLETALDIVERVAARHPEVVQLSIARSRLLRALDRSDEAASLLDAHPARASWEIAVERAALHRERGDARAQIASLILAAEARPEEASTYLDLGDAHLDDGALPEAIAAYDRALSLDARSDWARLSAAYARALATGAALVTERPVDASDARIAARSAAIEADLSAYTARLADPTDPIAGVLRGAIDRAAASNPAAHVRVRVRAERPLAPSARVAFEHALALAGRAGSLSVVVEENTDCSQFGPLWTARPTAGHGVPDVVPAVPRPPDEVIACIEGLCASPFGWDAWCAQAATLARALAPGAAEQLLAAIVYPPPPRSAEDDPVRWVHGFQIAATLIYAYSDKPAATRAARLSALTGGRDDWSAAAALLGLRALGRAEPGVVPTIVERACSLLPPAGAPLPPHARALAVTGGDLASGEARRDFLRLRARVRNELLDQLTGAAQGDADSEA